MPVNFNLLRQAGPANLAEGLMQGQEQQNALFQQQQQRQLGDIQLRNALRTEQEALAESEAAKSSTSLEDLARRQRQAGLGKQSLATEAAIAKQRADRANAAKTQIELLKASAGQIMANPESAVQILNRFGQMTGVDMSDDIAQIQGKDLETVRNWAASHALSADKLSENLRAKTEAAQLRPKPQPGAAPVSTENALGTPIAGISNALVAQPTSAAAKTFAAGRLATVEQEIGRMQDVLANNPENKLAADRLKAATEERNKLVAEDLASKKFEQEKKTAVEYVKTLKGVLRVNKADGTSELVLGPDGKPVTDVSAAQAIEAKRHAGVMESQGASRIQLENKRVNLEQERVSELKNDKVVANTVTDEAGNVRQYNRYGEQIGETKTGAGKPSAQFTKLREQKAELNKQLGSAITELTEITKDGGLIDQSTGSGAGRLVDLAYGFGGGATSGAIAIGKLKPIQDLVLKTIPRFEGPQSNIDVQSYKEAAGQLADPSMPTKIRKEAGKTVLRLMQKYKGQFATQEMLNEGGGAGGGGVDTNNPLLK